MAHAGIQADGGEQDPSISKCTWLPNGLEHRVDHAATDVIRLLNELNAKMNGDRPSECINSQEVMIPRRMAFAVQEIIRLLGSAAEKAVDASVKEEFLRQQWRVSTAWYGVLCGDIDNIHEFVANEEAARS